MLNMGVWPREEQAFVATVGPPHQVRAAATFPNLQDLAVSDRPVQRARSHHDPIADLRLHRVLLYLSVDRSWLVPALPKDRLLDRCLCPHLTRLQRSDRPDDQDCVAAPTRS